MITTNLVGQRVFYKTVSEDKPVRTVSQSAIIRGVFVPDGDNEAVAIIELTDSGQLTHAPLHLLKVAPMGVGTTIGPGSTSP